jgi:hypothetical protein
MEQWRIGDWQEKPEVPRENPALTPLRPAKFQVDCHEVERDPRL